MKFIVAIDFSDITDKVLHQSSLLAKSMGAEVVLMHVAEPNPDHIAYDYDPAAISVIDPSEIRNSVAQRFHSDHQQLQKYSEDLRAQGINCKGLMVQGPTLETLLKEISKLKVDFIVVGSHAKGMISQILLGSTSEALIKKSSVPVYLVPVDRDQA
jgi:nucleotide-binding universal stress UspA family protein